MKKLTALAALLALLTAPAMAAWKISPDGAALLEGDGSSSLSVICDKINGQTSWLVRVDALGLREIKATSVEVSFKPAGRWAYKVLGENRNGFIAIDDRNMPTKSDMQGLLSRLKAASTVTVTIADGATGSASQTHNFTLAGSRKAIAGVEKTCQAK